MPDDAICPGCSKLTSVEAAGDAYHCRDCNLSFQAGDHERSALDWRQKFVELRSSTGSAEPLEEPQLDPLCLTCNVRHPRRSPECA